MGPPIVGLREARLGAVVEQIPGADILVLGVVDDGRLEAIEREEVCDLLVAVLYGR